MVNEFSASASEIFAAAIQDYKRGVIIGSTSTYGKGTVQRIIPLEGSNNIISNNNQDLGTVKLTLQKFYRINGGSTQLRGVTPDIVIPDQLEYLKYREKDNPDALKWDEIQKATYTTFKPFYDINAIKSNSLQRIQSNSTFKAIKEGTVLLEKINDKDYSLNLLKYNEEQKQIKVVLKKMDDTSKLAKPLEISLLPIDLKRLSEDKDTNKLERRKQWMKSLTKDNYLKESINVVLDMINLSTLAKN
jgi:carboxyl-terminal processing protease